jgi:hypothetical protein
MAEIRYSLRYEHTWWQDVCRIEPQPVKWDELIHATEDILERKPEIITRQTKNGSRVLATRDFGFKNVPPMFVLFRIDRMASHPDRAEPPGGLVSLRHVITEEDVRMGLFFEYGDDLAADCQELRTALLRPELDL